jgi:hypothetical protein
MYDASCRGRDGGTGRSKLMLAGEEEMGESRRYGKVKFGRGAGLKNRNPEVTDHAWLRSMPPALTRMAPLCSGLQEQRIAGPNRSTGIVPGTAIVYGSRIRCLSPVLMTPFRRADLSQVQALPGPGGPVLQGLREGSTRLRYSLQIS